MIRNSITLTIVAALISGWIVWPVLTWKRGTSENVTVTLVAQPFIEAPILVYNWSGDVVRACDVIVRRFIVDSEGVVTDLIPRTFPRPPLEGLGKINYEVRVDVPTRIPEGPATYHAVEVPECNWLQRLWPQAVPYPPVEFVVSR